MTPAQFEALLAAFRQAQGRPRRGRRTTRRGRPRRRAAGAGRPHRHDGRRRLMALVWLRVHPAYGLLGFFFGLHKRNAQLNVRDALAAPDAVDDFPFGRPGRDRKKLGSAAEVMAASPEARVIIDAEERRVNRPTGYEARKPRHSGKKKAHAVKTQVVADPRGRIEAVSDSVPGGANHDLPLLCGSGAPERLAPGEAAMADKGYVGLRNYRPDAPVAIPPKASRGRPPTREQEAYNREVARRRIVVEHAMAQPNRFAVPRQVFRGRRRSRHGQVIRVAAKLVDRRLRVRPLKTYAA